MKEAKKYNYMDPILHYLLHNYISYNKYEAKRNRGGVVNMVVDRVVNNLKLNSLFNDLFNMVDYHGSYFDGLKIEHPDEFDVCLVFVLPEYLKPKLELCSNMPGYARIKCAKNATVLKDSSIERFIDEKHYLIPSAVYFWLFGQIDKYIKKLNHVMSSKSYKIDISFLESHGPAVTLKLNCSHNKNREEQFEIHIDLVPCFRMEGDKWHQLNIRNPVPSKQTFYIVPKEPKLEMKSNYWRLSFHHQERIIIKNRFFLKPVVKLLKKLRDHYELEFLSSYMIKNIFLRQIIIDEEENWKKSFSHYFMLGLKLLQKHMESAEVPYFWNEKDNLIAIEYLEHSSDNASQFLKNMIADIETSKNPFTFAEYLVNEDELMKIKQNVHIGKKTIKKYHLKM